MPLRAHGRIPILWLVLVLSCNQTMGVVTGSSWLHVSLLYRHCQVVSIRRAAVRAYNLLFSVMYL